MVNFGGIVLEVIRETQTQTSSCILKTPASYWNFAMVPCLIRTKIRLSWTTHFKCFKTPKMLSFLESWMRNDMYFETKSERKLKWSFVTGLYLHLTMKSQHLQKPTVLRGNLNGISLQYNINWILNRCAHGCLMQEMHLKVFIYFVIFLDIWRKMLRIATEDSHLGWFEVKLIMRY